MAAAACERLARQRGPRARTVDVADVARVLDVAFWASLRREEGYAPRVSLALLPPAAGAAGDAALRFAAPIPLAADAVARLAPAVERPGTHLGVWRDRGGLALWGVTRSLPRFCLVLEVVAPGVLVLKYRRAEPDRKFVNLAVLEGDQLRVLDDGGARAPACPAPVAALLGLDAPAAPAAWRDAADLLVQLAAAMRAHRRGGTLLVVPAEAEPGAAPWRASIARAVPYAVAPPFAALASRHGGAARRAQAVEAVAGLTAVDGATVVDGTFALLAFGAKITRRRGCAPVERVLATEPVAGSVAAEVATAQIGGTRHLSAAQFVHDQRDALAVVASQDGRVTLFTWADAAAAVRAHRIDAVLL
jgi:hypothetical protein